MTQFCLLLLLVAVGIVPRHCQSTFTLPIEVALFALQASFLFLLLLMVSTQGSVSFFSIFAVAHGVCVAYSQISFTTLRCPEYYSHLCLGVGRSAGYITCIQFNSNTLLFIKHYIKLLLLRRSLRQGLRYFGWRQLYGGDSPVGQRSSPSLH